LPEGGQPCFALGNHDRSRFISRNNEDGRGFERAKAAAILLMGLRNTPFVYYGEEIGMEDVDIPEERLQDPARIRTTGRDPERTPMQWDSSAGRGFSHAEPWLPYGPPERNVADQLDDDESLLALYRRAIWLRKRTPALIEGSYEELESPPGTWLFRRELEGSAPMLVAVNTLLEPVEVGLPGAGRVILSTSLAQEGDAVAASVSLAPLGAAMVLVGGS
jgi:alpha-glucosidase